VLHTQGDKVAMSRVDMERLDISCGLWRDKDLSGPEQIFSTRADISVPISILTRADAPCLDKCTTSSTLLIYKHVGSPSLRRDESDTSD
jgi:hypothetical protein